MKIKSNATAVELLTITFIVLKLCGTIDWSWWWVLSPTLIPLGIIGLLLLVLGIAGLFGKATYTITRK